jgi:hypothetical protein
MSVSQSALVAIFLTAGLGAQPGPQLREYHYKAKFLAFTTYYTSFPKTAPPAQGWVLGVIGKSPFGAYLDQVFTPRTTIKGRSVQVVYPKTPQEVASCDVLFICRSEKARLHEILSWVEGRPVLTVGDTKGYAKHGVMVNFTLERSFVRTEVNLPAARKVGLDFNSSFLKNSRSIHP